MQLEGLVSFVVQNTGRLVELITAALSQWGTNLRESVEEASVVTNLTYGIFGTDSGLIYWMKRDLIYLVNNLGTEDMAEKMANFIAALLVGSGAAEGFTFYGG